MQQAKIIKISRYRKKGPKERRPEPINTGKKGRVYSRGGKLWVDFHYLGKRVREPSGLRDTPGNRRALRGQLDLITAEIENGVFEFARRFPHSSRKEYFTNLEGRTYKKDPGEVLFGEYVDKWWADMEAGMSVSQQRDYLCILHCHLRPFFGDRAFGEFTPVLMKKFISHLKSRKTGSKKPLSAKRIQNIVIPLRSITRDAFGEYGWSDFPDPFSGLRLPGAKKTRVFPFSLEEWKTLIRSMPAWYRAYFDFAVQTGLRPSEQVALKWAAIDAEFVHIELSRVRNLEKTELKTEQSYRSIAIRPAMAKTLEAQKELTAGFRSPYVFLNTHGRPILQDKLRELWSRVMKKTGLKYRRMYETRHTFASWALAAGEAPEWVARTLGHVDTSMVFRTYGRYIPNLTRQDGSAFERQFGGQMHEKGNPK
jgi:integrase